MEKQNILFKVSDTLDWLEEYGATLSVTAWDKTTGYMIDEHVTEEFPELLDLGLDEGQEGDMQYYDHDFTVQEMIFLLEAYGFSAEEFNGTGFNK